MNDTLCRRQRQDLADWPAENNRLTKMANCTEATEADYFEAVKEAGGGIKKRHRGEFAAKKMTG